MTTFGHIIVDLFRRPFTRLCCLTVVALSFEAAVLSTNSLAETGYSEAERELWSLQQRSEPQVPTFTTAHNRQWVANAVDTFVLRKLNDTGLSPAPAVDRRTLVRRVYFQLTGLPPTPGEINAFLDDNSPNSYAKLVDRLLASPRYGEHWGQHWLDVIRYAETEGFEYDRHRAGAWRFRDYVIRSLNNDKPYDQFVREQLAGDEMVSDDEHVRRQQQVAVGFHRLGPIRRNAGNTEVAFSRNEVLTEMTDMVGTAFLGLTVGCARCHDHMFDPIRQKDYYQLQAFFAATDEHDIALASTVQKQAWQKRTDEINAEIERVKKSLEGADDAATETLSKQLSDLQARLPAPLPTISSVKNTDKRRLTIHILQRGDEFKKGKEVSPRLLGVLRPNDARQVSADAKKPKSVLADWITDPQNPLTARVIVNRIWQYHLGQAIVRTANDFGFNGDKPSHPELLDYLANELIRGGWRIKPIHRLILMSSTFRQSSRSPIAATAMNKDPDNRLLWRFARRRLEAQEVRDSMLAVSGRLNAAVGGPSVILPVDQEMVNLLYKPAQWEVTADKRQHDRRSIYLIAKRNLRLPFLEVFDQPDLQCTCARRVASTHAPQALELLNGKLSNQLATTFADRLARDAGPDVDNRIKLAFLRAAGRLPTPTEKQLAESFLTRQPLKEFALAMFNLNAFLYVD